MFTSPNKSVLGFTVLYLYEVCHSSKVFWFYILKEEVPVHLNYEIHTHTGRSTVDSVLDKHESHPLRDLHTRLPQQT